MKKIISAVLAATFLSSSVLALTACDTRPVLRVASWEEYIDEGGKNSYKPGSKSLDKEFEDWYHQQTGEKIRVDYIPIPDNEAMYNKISMGTKYDLLCPSEYMIMKLAAENRLEKFPDSFYDKSIDTNYYAKNVSPYIEKRFEEGKTADNSKWSEYAAGYMWGTTGFVFNPQNVARSEVESWNVVLDSKYNRKFTAKNNVRDSYFMGLGMKYETELLSLKTQLNNEEITREAYSAALDQKMNDTSEASMKEVEGLLKSVRSNGCRFETDEAKDDIIVGEYDISYQWSGDAVYIMDEAEKNEIEYEYCIPKAASNLWFDGWVMMKGAKVDVATMFINFISMPENVVRNMHYIGYTACVGGQEVFNYLEKTYGAEQGESAVDYDLGYFFGDGNFTLSVSPEQLKRQLFAQYPTQEALDRCVVMQYFDEKTNARADKLWNNVTGS